MKKIQLISFILISGLLITSCGQTEEEKNQMKALWDGFNMMKDIGDIWNSEGTEQEKQNEAIDRMAKGFWDMMDGSDEELTDEEKEALMQWANMLKDWGKGLKDEMDKVLTEFEKEELERKAKEKAESLKIFWTDEQPEWAIKKWIVKPEWFTFEYRKSTFKPDHQNFIMNYTTFYSGEAEELMEEALRLSKELWLKITENKANEFNPASVIARWEDEQVNYYIKAKGEEFYIKVDNKNWFSESEENRN